MITATMTTAVPQPPKLPKGHRANFETLKKAHRNGDLALVSATRKADGAPVALVCAIEILENGDFRPIPLAEMVNDNPFELYNDPTIV